MKPYEIAAEIKPSKRQLEWQKTEFYGFINIGLPTVVNREWTDGNIDPVNFVPDEFDAAPQLRSLQRRELSACRPSAAGAEVHHR